MRNLKQWKSKPLAPEELSNILHLDQFSTQLLFNRQIRTIEQVESFINPTSASLVDPYDLPEMELAVKRLKNAVENMERIGIFGDFDVDGISAAAILITTLKDFGISVSPYIPNRLYEGHGLNLKALDFFKAQEVSLIITVDCGTTDLIEVSNAKSMGIDVIITDHHLPLENRPNSDALINPNLPESQYSNKNLTGSGTAFKLATAVYECHQRKVPKKLLELAALGTISDVGILNSENRYIVSEGIKLMKNTQLQGLRAISKNCGTNLNSLNSQELSFKIIPRLNAPGRLEDPKTALVLLTTNDQKEAKKIALQLESLNEKRKNLTRKSILQALKQSKTDNPEIGLQDIVIVQHPDWHPGILGLIANHLSEHFSKPAMAIALDGESSKGSARSVVNFNIVDALTKCSDILTKFGGHSKAAGFTINENRIPELIKKLTRNSTLLSSNIDDQNSLEIECNTSIREVISHFDFISSLEPFGPGNPTPIFLSKEIRIIESKTVGVNKDHLKMTLSDKETYYDAIGFGIGNLISQATGYIDILYQISENTWNGMTNFQLIVKDFTKTDFQNNDL